MDEQKSPDSLTGMQLSGSLPDGGAPAVRQERDAGEVERALEQEGRVMVAAVNLPEKGVIPEELKRQVCDRVEALRRRRQVSLRLLAKQLGGKSHEAIISQVLRRKYDHPDDDLIRRLNAWVETTARRIEALRPVGICDTAIVKRVRAGCEFAKAQDCMVALVGPSGIGKTVAARAYCAEDLNAIYVRLRSTHTSPTAFLKQLADACNVEAPRGKARRMDAVISKLRGSHRLVVLDEWHLAERPLYEAVRDIHDVAEVPMVLLGTEEVQRRVVETRVRRGSVWSDQFCSRLGWIVDLARLHEKDGEPRPLFTEEEVREVFKSDRVRLSRDGVKFLQALACSAGLGCLRVAQRCYEMAAKVAGRRNGGLITERELRQAFMQQAVPDGMDDSVLVARVNEVARELKARAAG